MRATVQAPRPPDQTQEIRVQQGAHVCMSSLSLQSQAEEQSEQPHSHQTLQQDDVLVVVRKRGVWSSSRGEGLEQW